MLLIIIVLLLLLSGLGFGFYGYRSSYFGAIEFALIAVLLLAFVVPWLVFGSALALLLW